MADNEQRPVLVAIRIAAEDENGQPMEDMRMLCPGQLTIQKEDTYLLHYTENMQDEDTGETIQAEVRLKIRPGHVIMMRTGPYGVTMVFSKGQRCESTYHTPYGDMAMGIYTTRLVTDMDPVHTHLALDYQMDLNGGFGTMRRMQIDFGADEGRNA